MFRSDAAPWRALLAAFASSALLVLAACGERETPAPEAPPPAPAPAPEPADAARGLDAAGVAALDAALAELAASQDRAGFVAVIARDGVVRHVSAAGYADIEAGRPMTADTVVRIASMTKPVTAAAIMMLAEDGAVSLDDPVARFIPSFAGARVASSLMHDERYDIPTEALARPITIEDLLTHTSGVGYLFDYRTHLGALYIDRDIYRADGRSLAERIDVLAGLPLYFQPGERWFYSYSNDILGQVIAAASGMSVEAFMQARIFAPLGMADTSFFPDEALSERLAALYTHDEDGALVRVERTRDLAVLAQVEAGGAGLFSTANDYIRFAQMLANGGELDGVRVLSADSVAAMTTPHVGLDRMGEEQQRIGLAFGYSLGVYVNGDGGRLPGDYGWGGYFDTIFAVSPSTGLVAVMMAQEEPGPGTPDTTSAGAAFTRLIGDLVTPES
ncbi:beta-lactamase family protein [Alkalicaulis satelles]|uniref:Beta-lactamase family protein n=1 Tax=Alkalicaulis satelles TaxID=2609175 RepID=A0A5M6ZMT4_9PROT|nr:serine hydrolase domain-containing protein [Alkalicaulis satelles]KAA5805225.1 beta-lactamase family protein [Alkalicaulis satelles]